MTLPKFLTTITTFSKLLALILFILFPIAGFYVGMTYQQSIKPVNQTELLVQSIRTPTPITTETIGWKTYTDSIHQYVISYPTDWILYPYDNETGQAMLWYQSTKGTQARVNIGPSNYVNVTEPIETWLKQQKPEDSDGSIYTLIKITSLNGNVAYKTIWNALGVISDKRIVYFIPHNNTVYTLTLEMENPPSSDNFDESGSPVSTVFSRILSTFKFLDTATPSFTSPQASCEQAKGRWVKPYSECEFINEAACQQAGGTYEHCTSACRHDPNYPDVSCIKMCVSVCSFL